TAELDESMPRFDLSIIARRDLLPTPAVSHFVTCLQRAVNETLG
ncbi:LysR family transcriptional regulator, partial [Burkholderia cenocepacia]|nr:LysR family transcriptional regulator [Burkholderia cenocepacia]